MTSSKRQTRKTLVQNVHDLETRAEGYRKALEKECDLVLKLQFQVDTLKNKLEYAEKDIRRYQKIDYSHNEKWATACIERDRARKRIKHLEQELHILQEKQRYSDGGGI